MHFEPQMPISIPPGSRPYVQHKPLSSASSSLWQRGVVELVVGPVREDAGLLRLDNVAEARRAALVVLGEVQPGSELRDGLEDLRCG